MYTLTAAQEKKLNEILGIEDEQPDQSQNPLNESVSYLSEDSAYEHIAEHGLTDVEVVENPEFKITVFKVVKI